MSREREIREGERFGLLTVIDVTDEGAIRCRCGCGVRKRFDRPSDVLLAKSCGCVRRAVPADEGSRHTRKRKRPPTFKRTPWSVVEMIRNAPAIVSTRQLARETGMTPGNVSRIRRGVIHAEAPRVIADRQSKKAKLTRFQVAQLLLPFVEEVAQRHGLTPKQVTGGARIAIVSSVRQEAMWTLRQKTKASFPSIGMALGGRHHTTVIHGIRAFEHRLATEPELRARVLGEGKAA